MHRAGGTPDADPRADRGRALRRRGADRGGRDVRRRRRRTRPRPTARCCSPTTRRTSRAARCARCAATSRRTGAWSSSRGSRARGQTGPARVFDDEFACVDGRPRRARAPGDVLVVRYEGPAGGPGMREMLQRDVVGRGRRARRVGRARHRRALLRRDARADGRPRLARGGARRAARGGPRRRRDHDRHRTRACSSVDVPDDGAARAAAGLGAARGRPGRAACSPATARRSARRPTAPCCARSSVAAAASDAGARHAARRRRERRPSRRCRCRGRRPASCWSGRVEVGVCGTDREIAEGLFGIAPAGEDRLILGHEVLGRVERGRARLRAPATSSPRRCGARAATATRAPRGRPTRAGPATTASTGSRGCTASPPSSRSVPAEHLIAVPEALRDVGVLAEPASICARAVRHALRRRAVASRGRRRARSCFGAGAIGMLCTYLLRLEGLDVWTVGARAGRQREGAARRGVGRALRPGRRGPLPRPAGAGGFDIVIVAAASADLSLNVAAAAAPRRRRAPARRRRARPRRHAARAGDRARHDPRQPRAPRQRERERRRLARGDDALEAARAPLAGRARPLRRPARRPRRLRRRPSRSAASRRRSKSKEGLTPFT